MYTPKFTITNKILRNIGQIEAAKEVIENAPIRTAATRSDDPIYTGLNSSNFEMKLFIVFLLRAFLRFLL